MRVQYNLRGKSATVCDFRRHCIAQGLDKIIIKVFCTDESENIYESYKGEILPSNSKARFCLVAEGVGFEPTRPFRA